MFNGQVVIPLYIYIYYFSSPKYNDLPHCLFKKKHTNTIRFKISFSSWNFKMKDCVKKIKGEKMEEYEIWKKTKVILKLYKSFFVMLCNLDLYIFYIKKF